MVNYTSHDVSYTRVIEHKHFEMFGQEVYDCPKTVVSEEYSTEYKPGMEPYYPVNDERNNQLAEAYRELAKKEENVIFGGRLAQYKYYDMAPVIEEVMKNIAELLWVSRKNVNCADERIIVTVISVIVISVAIH